MIEPEETTDYAGVSRQIDDSQTENSGMSKSMHDGVEVWCDCCSCEAEPYWVEALKEISNVVPHNIYITEISMQKGREGVKEITLRGIILAGREATLASLSKLMLTLERGIFKNVALVTTRKYEEIEGSSMFELKGEID